MVYLNQTSIKAGILLLFSLFPNTVISATYYVSQQGNNNNSGISWTSAWKNIQYASDRAIAGDTVIIRKGPKHYPGFTIKNNGTQNKPITFTGENANDPPVMSGATHQSHWRKHTNRIWKTKTSARPNIIVEDKLALDPATSSTLVDGNWFWEDNIIYYRPTSSEPKNHDVWRTSRGGSVSIRDKEWITIKNIECWLGGGACISIINSNNVSVSSVKSSLYWRGIDIGENSHHNHVKDCLLEQNRSGIYIRVGSSYNIVQNSKSFHNGNQPTWSKGDRAGIAIGEAGSFNIANIIENCEIAYNGGPNSDPGLIAYRAPQTIFRNNYIHNNYSSGLYVAIHSDHAKVLNNIVENNGKSGVLAGYKGIAGLSIRRSHTALVKDNTIKNNYVSSDSRWKGKDLGPRGGLDIRGLPNDNMRNIDLINNKVSNTIGGPNLYISKYLSNNAVTVQNSTTSLE